MHSRNNKQQGIYSLSFSYSSALHGSCFCRLLRLRNTWGKFSWTGDWCEHSACWNVVPPEVKATLSTKGAEEGLFWISFDDWLR